MECVSTEDALVSRASVHDILAYSHTQVHWDLPAPQAPAQGISAAIAATASAFTTGDSSNGAGGTDGLAAGGATGLTGAKGAGVMTTPLGLAGGGV